MIVDEDAETWDLVLVLVVEMVVKKIAPVLFRQLGIFLPLMTTNCAIFGLAIFQTNRGYDFLQGIVAIFAIVAITFVYRSSNTSDPQGS